MSYGCVVQVGARLCWVPSVLLWCGAVPTKCRKRAVSFVVVHLFGFAGAVGTNTVVRSAVGAPSVQLLFLGVQACVPFVVFECRDLAAVLSMCPFIVAQVPLGSCASSACT